MSAIIASIFSNFIGAVIIAVLAIAFIETIVAIFKKVILK